MKNEVIFVSGQRGSGKTYWVKNFIQGQGRYLLFDAISEYGGASRFEDIEALVEYCKAHQGKGFFEAIYDPPNPLDEDNFDIFCRLGPPLGNLYVIIEEIDQFAKTYYMPETLQRLIKYGRHYGVNVIGVSRNPSEVSRLLTSQATRFVLFRQIEPRYVAYFKSVIGEWAENLPRLDVHWFMDIDFSKSPTGCETFPAVQKLP